MTAYYKVRWRMGVPVDGVVHRTQPYEVITHSATAADTIAYLLCKAEDCDNVRIEDVPDTDWPF